ncbi:Integrase, catalytic domain [Pseudooceanicola batsensis HTCC2597]|uniref:Integrase, catalytic domain n=1 Tax=Pseudooceanicola batsensis (strain ATCC BAA-863 / DSM 15984 / KCTC 12145 / HTCC2597) TaxID=252305 RepID=A3U3E5_PSEBH|nr:Integrase, catalytic domain [Pseudooceanicola batsensis HTCC2597]
MVTPAARREAVAHLCEAHQVSQRRACSVLDVDRSSVRYRSVRPDDADLRQAMKVVAAERRRFGYRRVHVMLERQGWRVNQKKLQVRKRGGRKRALGTLRPMFVPEKPNERWSLGFRL